MKKFITILLIVSGPLMAKPFLAFTYTHPNYKTDDTLKFTLELDVDCAIRSSKPVHQYWLNEGVVKPLKMSAKYFGITKQTVFSPNQVAIAFPIISNIDLIESDRKYILLTAKKAGDSCSLTSQAFFKSGGVKTFRTITGNYKGILGKKTASMTLTNGTIIQLGKLN